MAGDFCWTVTLTDVHTQWTETRAVWNKGQHGVQQRIAEIEKALPFPILGFDSDNGGEPERSGDSLPQAARRASGAMAIHNLASGGLFSGSKNSRRTHPFASVSQKRQRPSRAEKLDPRQTTHRLRKTRKTGASGATQWALRERMEPVSNYFFNSLLIDIVI